MAHNRGFFVVLLLVLAVVVAAGFLAGRFFDPALTFELTAYWYLWATLGFVAWTVFRPDVAARLGELARDRRLWWALGGGVLLTALIALAVAREFRVLADETNLVGTSFSMYLDRTARNIIEGESYFQRFHVKHAEMPTRPLLFPFAMAILHGILGFDPDHGFVVNLVASALTLTVVAGFGIRLAGAWYGGLAAVLLASFPLYAQCVRASGFEVLNLLMIMLVGAQLWRFLVRPTPNDGLLLVLLGLLAAQCRYESVTLFAPIGLAFLLHLRKLLDQKLPWALALTPLLALPILWQRAVATALNAGDAGKEPFLVEVLPKHLGGAFLYFLNWPDGAFATNSLVFLVALIGLAWLGWRAVVSRSHSPERVRFAALAALGLALILVVQCAYYLGDMRFAFIARMGLSFAGAIAMLAAYPIWRGVRALPRAAAPLALVGALAVCVHGWSHAAVNEHGRSLYLYREYKRTLAHVRSHPREGTLVVSDRPSMYASNGYGAVGFGWARRNTRRIERALQRGLYGEVIVLQHVRLDTGVPEAGFELELPLETVEEFQNTDRIRIRIARVVARPPAGDERLAHPPDAP